MLKTRRERVQFITFFGTGLIAAGALFFFLNYRLNARPKNAPEPVYGVTFSKIYAEDFGLDWKSVYIAALDDLKIRRFRIPVYWNDIEPAPKKFNFGDYDWMLAEAEKRGAKIILGIGRKLPRWPECHIPAWAEKLTPQEQQLKLAGSLATMVKHFRESPAVLYWQVENEALFPFGICPKPDSAFLKTEVEIVHDLDKRPVVITDSGELSTWLKTSEIGDILGISMYRATWDNFFGYFYFPIPPAYYNKKADVVSPRLVEKVIVTELQAEPWGRLPLTELPISEQYGSMNIPKFRANVDFAYRTGMPEIYLWGVEWWYWVREKHNNPDFWNEAKKLWNK